VTRLELLSSTQTSQLVGLVHPRGVAQLQLMLGNVEPRFQIATQYGDSSVVCRAPYVLFFCSCIVSSLHVV
jgi:hypothetical protein